MRKTITVVELARRNPEHLFAVGEGRKEFYFIEPPKGSDKDFFDGVYSRVESGERVELEADVLGRGATFIIPSELEANLGSSQVEGIQASLVEVDLYSLIHDAKEAQFAEHGKHSNYGYEEKMQALEAGIPQERLQESSLARNIVKVLLQTGRPTHMFGEGDDFYAGIKLSNVDDTEVRTMIHDLQQGGLLDFTFHCHGPNEYAFETEFIITTLGSGYLQSKFAPNQVLRDNLRTMLKPFEDESFNDSYGGRWATIG
jgi:hypothetical protein